MNLVSTATDDSEKVFQEAIEQVNREFSVISPLIAANYFVAEWCIMPVESATRCLQLHSLFDPTLSNLVPREWPVKDGPGLEPTVPQHHLLQNLPTCSAPCREWLVPGPKMAKDLFIKDCLRSGKRKTQLRTQALFTRLDHKRLVTSCVTVLPSFKMWFLWSSL